jgi:DNA-binding CsgD family transcriptional regulator
MTSAEIAVILAISPRTVDLHIAAACERLEVRTRVQAAARAKEFGLISAGSPAS